MATGFRFPNRNDNIVLLYQRVIHQNEFALTTFRALVDFELDVRDCGLFVHGDVFPPVFQAIHDEVTGLEGTAKGHPLAGP
jgi:hypothetical protein